MEHSGRATCLFDQHASRPEFVLLTVDAQAIVELRSTSGPETDAPTQHPTSAFVLDSQHSKSQSSRAQHLGALAKRCETARQDIDGGGRAWNLTRQDEREGSLAPSLLLAAIVLSVRSVCQSQLTLSGGIWVGQGLFCHAP